MTATQNTISSSPAASGAPASVAGIPVGVLENLATRFRPSGLCLLLLRQARLLLTMVRDQIRLAGVEHELTTLSGQLANTYEELSLIYQISGGMRINRLPADFFKQACIDSIEVMGVRGMGVALRVAST